MPSSRTVKRVFAGRFRRAFCVRRDGKAQRCHPPNRRAWPARTRWEGLAQSLRAAIAWIIYTMEIADPVGAVLNGKNPELWTVSPDATVYAAIELMAAKNIGSLLVMEGKRLRGIVSERDYTRKVILQGRSSKTTPVRSIMTSKVVCAQPSDSVETCIHVMSQSGIRHLPVMEGDEVTGIVSLGDLVRWIMSAQSVRIHQLEHYIAGTYPA